MAQSEAVLHNRLTKAFGNRWSLFGMTAFFSAHFHAHFNAHTMIPDDRSGFWTYGPNLLHCLFGIDVCKIAAACASRPLEALQRVKIEQATVARNRTRMQSVTE